ncbi:MULTISPECIES: CS1 type fimbrial major subunit [Pseudomonas]|uniref:Adhesin major subunit pilin n=1 Tax=Pseudomonas fluorescens LMG 5329 TaxID=1324332 RepID=A0A0A1Z365_PSEFL|nr:MULTISPECIES: CS1 type fimbrial major subunit [Pseudomonas]KGE67501.1 adhesin major subunit pilin [Pseudomonas fluorescens LMG 5329]NWD99462.1 adhesin [Pseudomonas sp. IPO3749]NWF18855.1 adhesin [Pseudomonas sp. IPO3749]
MYKILALVILVIVLGLSVSQLEAAVERETFEVSVTIPTADFYVLPVDPRLVQREQKLAYNPVTSQLAPLRAPFDVKNVGGAIGARLDQAAYLSNGTDHVALRVTFNEVELGLTQSEVVSTADARPGKRVGLEIAAIKPDDDYRPGNYFGTVHMVFDAIAP